MSTDNKENTAAENLKDGYEQIKTIYQIQADRLKTSDEKLNMMLVFNAAIIALLIVVIPFPETGVRSVLSIALFSIFAACMLITVICIFIGLFPRKLDFIDVKNYTNANQYNCTREEHIGKYMSGYEAAIESVANVAEKKQTMIKHSMIETLVNIVLIVAMIVIKVI